MENLKRWMIPGAGLVGVLAFLVAYALAGSREETRGPKASPSTQETTLPRPAGALALSGGPRPSLEVQPKGSGPSRALPEAKVPLNGTGGGRGPLGYLRDISQTSGEAGRKDVIRRTAEHLGVPEGSREDFEKAATLALSEMKNAAQLQYEEAQALGLLTPGSRKAIPSEASQQLQERYAARRAGALGRLEPYLGDSPAGVEFRANFEGWVATVRWKGQGSR